MSAHRRSIAASTPAGTSTELRKNPSRSGSSVEFAVGVYETLHAAGKRFSLKNAGYYALESLRIEKGYRAWGRELSPDTNPFEAGLAFACKLGKDISFTGRDALLKLRNEPLKRRLVVLTADGAHDRMLWGGEAIIRDGQAVGFVSSAAFGHTLF